jgi:hypothetical protein
MDLEGLGCLKHVGGMEVAVQEVEFLPIIPFLHTNKE